VTFDLVRRCVLAVVTTATATVLIPAPSASADPCPDVEVVFARGTSEPAGIGRVGQALADALQAQIAPRVVGTYGVIYPATYDFLTAADGAADATNHITAMAAQCPNTRIVLGGYSQGAAVVDMLAGVPPLGDRVGSIGSAPPLPGGLDGNVAAVAVFGNPATKFGNPVSGTGAFAGRSIDLCSDGDPICSRGRNPFAHTHYESSDFIPQAAGFVASRV
jgi:trehalose dimycolate hydrolase